MAVQQGRNSQSAQHIPTLSASPAHHKRERERPKAAAVDDMRRRQLLIVCQHPAVTLQPQQGEHA